MLRLVPFGPEHFPLLSQWFASQADVVQWGGPALSFPLTVPQLEGMLAEAESVPPSRLCWMVTCKDAMVGHAQLGFDWRNGNARLSRVVVAPAARGQGVARPMLRLIVDEAFARPAIGRVELNVYTWNTPAIRTYEKLGFRTEGVRRSAACVDGVCWDAAIMGLLRPEWATSDGPLDNP